MAIKGTLRNSFNPAGKTKTIEGSVDLKTLGLDAIMKYVSSDPLAANGCSAPPAAIPSFVPWRYR